MTEIPKFLAYWRNGLSSEARGILYSKHNLYGLFRKFNCSPFEILDYIYPGKYDKNKFKV